MKPGNIISIGDEVHTPRRGRQKVTAIEYAPKGPDVEPQNLDCIHCSDAMTERVVFVFESGHFAYGSQVVSIKLAENVLTAPTS